MCKPKKEITISKRLSGKYGDALLIVKPSETEGKVYSVAIKLYKIKGEEEGQLIFETPNCFLTFDKDQAETLVTGFIKWDGCSDLTFASSVHFCDKENWEDFAKWLLDIREYCAKWIRE